LFLAGNNTGTVKLPIGVVVDTIAPATERCQDGAILGLIITSLVLSLI
jgi:hypothetical protein